MTDGRTVRIAISLSRVSMLVLVLGDDELHQSQSAVDAHIFPMLVQTAYFHFIPGQITFAYTAPPTRLLTNGENI